MSKVLAIAQREIRERAFVFVAATAIALLPFLALVVPAANFSVADRIGAAAQLGVGLAIAYTFGLGMLLGSSLIGREMREKRLSFYFTRPVSATSLWFGKLLAAAALLAGSAAIVFIGPAFIVPHDWSGVWGLSVPGIVRVWLAWAAAAVLVVHTIASMLRSRSPLAVLDFIALLLFLFALWAIFLPFVIARVGLETAGLFAKGTGGAICVVLMFAGAWQLAYGRIDPKRGHRQLSIAVWSGLTVVLIVTAAAMQWFTSVTPADLKGRFSVMVPSEGAVIVTGTAPHRRDFKSTFLISVNNGAWQAAPLWTSYLGMGSNVNDAGTVAVWWRGPNPFTMFSALVFRNPDADAHFDVARLRGSKWVVQDSGITVRFQHGQLFTTAISPAGDRFAVLNGGTLTVYDLGTARSIGSARVKVPFYPQLLFAGPDSVIVWSAAAGPSANASTEPHHLVAERFDARSRQLRRLLDLSMEPQTNAFAAVIDQGRTLMVIITGKLGRSVRYFDALSGAERTAMNEGAVTSRLPRVVEENGHLALQTFSDSGAVAESIDLGRAESGQFAGFLPDGRLIISERVGRFTREYDTSGARVLIVDPKAKSVRVVATNLTLLPRSTVRRATHGQVVFAAVTNGDVVSWNAETGQRRSLLLR